MGINRAALVAQSDFIDLREIERGLGIALKESRRATWEEAKTEAFFTAELMFVQKGDRLLLYFDIDFFQAYYEALYDLSQGFHRALLFVGSETAMNFSFEWFSYKKPEGRDDYNLATDFQVDGSNRLALKAGANIFFDGLFPYTEEELALSDSDVCLFYKYQKEDYWPESKRHFSLVEYDKAINDLLHSKTALNGLLSLERLRELYRIKREAGFAIPSSSLKASLSDRALRKKIYQASKSWEEGLAADTQLAERKAIAILWATRDIDLQDLYAGTYKGNWWG